MGMMDSLSKAMDNVEDTFKDSKLSQSLNFMNIMMDPSAMKDTMNAMQGATKDASSALPDLKIDFGKDQEPRQVIQKDLQDAVNKTLQDATSNQSKTAQKAAEKADAYIRQ